MRFGDCGIGSVQIHSDSRDLARQRGCATRNVTIKGDSEPDELIPGVTYSFHGEFRKYHNQRSGMKESQFWFKAFTTVVQHDEDGIVAYLVSVGKGNHLGQATAKKAWDRWGSDAVRQVRENPLQLCELGRISEEQAERIGERLKQLQITESSMIELTDLLVGRGFPKTLPRKCIKSWGNLAGKIIRKDPYRLMQFRGCGFNLCDRLYLELGLDPLKLRRQTLRGWYEIASDSSGDTWFPIEKAERSIASMGSRSRPAKAMQLGERLGRLSPDHYGALARTSTASAHGELISTGGRHWIAEGRKAEQERTLADLVGRALRETPSGWLWPDASQLELDDHQRQHITAATASNIGILGGSPGTGKTYSVAQLVKAILRKGIVRPEDIAIGAPTGKAAVRVTENLLACGANVRARTWHSLLGVSEQDSESGSFGFRFNRANPWDYKILIGDESSMLDTALMKSVFAARPRGCHMLLVGDVNQLAPVGHGAPLRDMLAAGIPQGELTEIKRNSGGIVETCAAIRDANPWEPGDNLQLVEARTPSEQLAATERILADLGEFNPTWDAQVLSAVNLRSKISRKMVNDFLQPILNQNPKQANVPFSNSDKVVCTTNGYYGLDEGSYCDSDMVDADGRVYVANGELAQIVDVQPKQFIAELSSPDRRIRIPRGKADNGSSGCNFDLAYSLSCHKSQGSEWPVVIVLLDEYPGARQVCDRSWLYTAISRARHKCYLVGRKSTADAMCRRNNIVRRKTFLRELIGLDHVNHMMLAI